MNDERPIEKLLRRYATRRRDEAGAAPELHPATRRLLHGEVARQYPKPASASEPSATTFFSLLTRRWIYAVGIFVLLGLVAAMLLPSMNESRQGTMLAQKTASEEIVMRENQPPAAAPTVSAPAETRPTLAAAESRRSQPVPESVGGDILKARDESATISYSVSPGAAAGSAEHSGIAQRDTDSLRPLEEAGQVSPGMKLDASAPARRTLAAQSPAHAAGEARPIDSFTLAERGSAAQAGDRNAADGFGGSRPAAAPRASVAAAPNVSTSFPDKGFVARDGGLEKDARQLYSQSYANTAPPQLRAQAKNAKAETPVASVLANFQVQNVGNEVRVIDSDGSTYRGVLNGEAIGQLSGAAGKAVTGNYARQDSRPAPSPGSGVNVNQPATQNYLWRVEGTNRTLNQNVVFSWNFVETNRASATSQLNAAVGALNQDAAKLPSQFQLLLNNSVIDGRAQLGPAQQIEVNALPVSK